MAASQAIATMALVAARRQTQRNMRESTDEGHVSRLYEDKEQYPIIVGDRAHRIVGQLLQDADLPNDRLLRAARILRAGRDVLARHPVESRQRAVLVEACGAASAYFHRFSLGPSWRFVGAEVGLGSGRVDLIFQLQNGRMLVDELKFGLGRSTLSTLHKQIDKYLDAGTDAWSGSFIGVRLCAVSEPNWSRLYLASSRRVVAARELSNIVGE